MRMIGCSAGCNKKTLLCKFPNYNLHKWVNVNYHIHLWMFPLKASRADGEAHLLRTRNIPHKSTLSWHNVATICTSQEIFIGLQWHLYRRASRCTCCVSQAPGLAPPSCPAVYLICKGVLRSSSTVSAKVLYSSHNPKWQQQHQDELQERGGSLAVIYNALNSSTLLIVCITRNQTRGKTNNKRHFLFWFNTVECTSLSFYCCSFTSGNRDRDYSCKGKTTSNCLHKHHQRMAASKARLQKGRSGGEMNVNMSV